MKIKGVKLRIFWVDSNIFSLNAIAYREVKNIRKVGEMNG